MMEQYLRLKAEAGDCLLFYRMGDFFELFFDDAQIAAGVLDIALTSRGEHAGKPVPMCGVPVHSAESYLARLIKAGKRVAIAEQVETPEEAKQRAKREGRGSKALVARDIVRFVTAGTLTEQALLNPRQANVLAAVCQVRGGIGIASADISTGRMVLEECTAGEIDAVIARLSASEIVVPEGWTGVVADATMRPAAEFASERGSQRLKALHGVATLDGMGAFKRPMLAAAGGLMAYLDHVGRGSLPFLLPPVVRAADSGLAMDASTRASLAITQAQDGERTGSLLAAVDRCSTGAGSRLLAEDLCAPLTSRPAIEARLASVSYLHADPLLRADLRGLLGGGPDLGRALGRVAAGRGSPRDLGQIRDTIVLGHRVAELLDRKEHRPGLLDAALAQLTGHAELAGLLASALIPSPPTDRGAGGYIAAGHMATLDELRALSSDARRAVAALEAKYRTQTGIAALKIKHNNVLGYFIEVPAKHADALMEPGSGFSHRQTMAGALRFNSVILHEEAGRIIEAAARALALEEEEFARLCEAVDTRRTALAATADALARIDVSAALAERAAEGDWCRPDMQDEPCFDVIGGRHPVVEAALAKDGETRFVANDCALDGDDRLWLIGGPNMGGKSTFLRQNALILLLAQAGSFVPATSATIGIADRLFSRVGASDNLAHGRSTFMVEMVETAAILSGATQRSFVILDEVGRGTSTYDGLALAWAVIEAVHENLKCRCLFATHYHELARLAESCDALSLHHVRAREWKGELVLLHELAKGAADQSYGLAVARLAGVPAQVVNRAQAVLAKLEKGRAETGGLAAGLGDLPLFAATVARTRERDELREELRTLDIDALSPREALDMLYALKRQADER